MDDRLIFNVNIIFVSIGERVVHIMLVTPPIAAQTIDKSSCCTCKVIAYGASTVAIVMAYPPSLLHR